MMSSKARGNENDGALTGHSRDVVHHFFQCLQVGPRLQLRLLQDSSRQHRNIPLGLPGTSGHLGTLLIIQGLIDRYLPGVDCFVVGLNNLLRLVIRYVRAIVIPQGYRADTELEESIMNLLRIASKVGHAVSGGK
jgi:hypothetical protein